MLVIITGIFFNLLAFICSDFSFFSVLVIKRKNALKMIHFLLIFFYQVANTSTANRINDTYRYTLDGLKYANTLYDVRVYMKSQVAVGEDKWSAPAISTFRTRPTGEYVDNLVEVGSHSSRYEDVRLLGCCTM